MTKKNKRSAEQKPITEKSSNRFPTCYLDYLFIFLLMISLIILLKPIVIDRLSPHGVDVIGSKGQSHQIALFNKETGKHALWNPYIFAGMPLYQRSSPTLFSIDYLLELFSHLTNHIFIYYLFAAIGFYLLIRYLKMRSLIAFFSALSFILLPHYQSLYLEGHFAKFYAIMYLPWIFLSFKYFLDKRHLFSAALFALIFGMQIKTQHYQIIFYTILLIFTLGLQPLLKNFLQKEYKLLAKSLLFVLCSILLAILLAAQPLFSAREYIPYSKRGKTTINLQKPELTRQTSKTAGVTLEYATQWSTHPSELLTWIIPRFYGGMSAEIYRGNAYPQLRNRQIPGYWGHMPFTQSYEYIGIITIILALIAIPIYKTNKMILSLIIFTAFLILLSLGRHFQLLYKIFFNYFPYFNKFRAPAMSVTMSSFLICIFAAYGINNLTELKTGLSLKEYKNLLYIFGGFIVLGLVIYISSHSFSFIKTGESYDDNILTILKNIRKEFLMQDLTRYFILIVLLFLITLSFLKNKVPVSVLILLIIGINIFDLWNIHSHYHSKFIDQKKIERQYFAKTATDQFLLEDRETYRIYPAGNLFSDNRWAYYHQTIGGYSAIKMYTIEELIENNLNHSIDNLLPINWNVLQFLNVKYVIIEQEVNHPKLQLVHQDQANRLFTYLFTDHLNRCFFTGEYKVIEDEFARLRMINSPEFNVTTTAILEEPLKTAISSPDSSFCELIHFSPDRVSFDLFTDKTSLLVISELYYPPGWKIYLDGKKVEKVYKTDHAIQSIITPQGNHTVDLKFEADTYEKNIKLSFSSLSIIYLVILCSILKKYKSNIMNYYQRIIKRKTE